MSDACVPQRKRPSNDEHDIDEDDNIIPLPGRAFLEQQITDGKVFYYHSVFVQKLHERAKHAAASTHRRIRPIPKPYVKTWMCDTDMIQRMHFHEVIMPVGVVSHLSSMLNSKRLPCIDVSEWYGPPIPLYTRHPRMWVYALDKERAFKCIIIAIRDIVNDAKSGKETWLRLYGIKDDLHQYSMDGEAIIFGKTKEEDCIKCAVLYVQDAKLIVRYGPNGPKEFNAEGVNFDRPCIQMVDSFVAALISFCRSPTEYLASTGKLIGECMHCGAALSDPKSVSLGMGPICYKNWMKIEKYYMTTAAAAASTTVNCSSSESE